MNNLQVVKRALADFCDLVRDNVVVFYTSINNGVLVPKITRHLDNKDDTVIIGCIQLTLSKAQIPTRPYHGHVPKGRGLQRN